MRTVRKDRLRLDEEIYRYLITMLKKLKLSKKEDRIVIAEAVADLFMLFKVMPFLPVKYSVLFNNEEIAKIIYYRKEMSVILHDLYVSPKYRKQEVAKILIVEVLSDNRDMPQVEFHARESNKPIHNLTNFFVRKFEIAPDRVSSVLTSEFYVDGGKAIYYTVPNPAFEMSKEEVPPPPTEEEIVDDTAAEVE